MYIYIYVYIYIHVMKWITPGHLKNLAMLREMLGVKRGLVRLFPALQEKSCTPSSNFNAFMRTGVHCWQRIPYFHANCNQNYVSCKFAFVILSTFVPMKLLLKPHSWWHKSPCSDPNNIKLIICPNIIPI